MNCQHGGTANANGTSCVNCLGAWSGQYCEKWDESIPVSAVLAKLDVIANNSLSMLKAQEQYNPLCRQGQECVGWGADAASGSPSNFPIAHLTYTDSTRVYHGFREPVQAQVTPNVNPTFAFDTHAFPTIADFTDFVGTTFSGASPPLGTNGIFGQLFSDVFANFYQRADDSALSVARAALASIQLSLPFDPITQKYTLQFDKFALQAILSLPPDYNTSANQQIYDSFIKSYGTSVVVKASMGGLLELYSNWKTPLSAQGFDVTKLIDNANIDFTTTTGLGGHTAAHDAGYAKSTTLNPLNCIGGDPSKCANVSSGAWKDSVAANPRLVAYELAPISELVSDPAVKTNLEKAVDSYILQKTKAWEEADKCPTKCEHSSTCAKPASACTCRLSFIGRMCSECGITNPTADSFCCAHIQTAPSAPQNTIATVGDWSDNNHVYLVNGPSSYDANAACVVSYAYAPNKGGGATGKGSEIIAPTQTLSASRSDDFCKRYGAENSVSATASVSTGLTLDTSCSGAWGCSQQLSLAAGSNAHVQLQDKDWSKACRISSQASIMQAFAASDGDELMFSAPFLNLRTKLNGTSF